MDEKSGKEDFWSGDEDQVLRKLETSRLGLTEDEVRKRLDIYGQNVLRKKRLYAFEVFLRQFKSPFLWILIVISIVSMFLGQTISSLIILVMIFLSSLLSFFDEYKSEKIVEQLNKKIAHKALVIRAAEKKEVSVHNLVPGDMVFLTIGSVVPADIRLLYTKEVLY